MTESSFPNFLRRGVGTRWGLFGTGGTAGCQLHAAVAVWAERCAELPALEGCCSPRGRGGGRIAAAFPELFPRQRCSWESGTQTRLGFLEESSLVSCWYRD